ARARTAPCAVDIGLVADQGIVVELQHRWSPLTDARLANVLAPTAQSRKSGSRPKHRWFPPPRAGEGPPKAPEGADAGCGAPSAMNTFVSPGCVACRFDSQISFLPSCVNIGKPSKFSSNVICCSPVPSRLIRKRSKLPPLGSFMFEAKMICRPLGWK